MVKALAVATPYQYLEVFKTPLVLALDQYLNLSLKAHSSSEASSSSDGASNSSGENTSASISDVNRAEIAVLAELYEALNSVDLSAMPRFSEPARSLMWRGVPGTSALVASANRANQSSSSAATSTSSSRSAHGVMDSRVASPGGGGGGSGSGSEVAAHSPSSWTWSTTCALKVAPTSEGDDNDNDTTTTTPQDSATPTVQLPLTFPLYASWDEVVGAESPVLSTLAATLGGDQLLKVSDRYAQEELAVREKRRSQMGFNARHCFYIHVHASAQPTLGVRRSVGRSARALRRTRPCSAGGQCVVPMSEIYLCACFCVVHIRAAMKLKDRNGCETFQTYQCSTFFYFCWIIHLAL